MALNLAMAKVFFAINLDTYLCHSHLTENCHVSQHDHCIGTTN